MLKLFKNLFTPKEKYDASFFDVTNLYYMNWPIIKAKDFALTFQKTQKDAHDEFKFLQCPGMADFSKIGYIIVAPTDIYIKGNSAGSYAHIGSTDIGLNRESDFLKNSIDAMKIPRKIFPKPICEVSINTMDHTMVDGTVRYEDNVPPNVFKYNLPWKVKGYNKNIGFYILPPTYHNPKLLENLHLYPGNVDFGKGFSTINFVFSIKRKCEFIIRNGEPLLHIIPYSENNFDISYGACNFDMRTFLSIKKKHETPKFYNRYYWNKKKFNLEKHDVTVDFE